MKILALEFSSPQRSVAVVQDGPDGERLVLTERVETGIRSTHAFGMIEAALDVAQLEREQIDCLAVGMGPGSYNGIRLAIALAQGWQLGSRQNGVKLLGISSAECLAAQAQSEGIFGRVGVVIDAQRNEFYFARYEISDSAWGEVEPLRLTGLSEIQAWLQDGAAVVGPEAPRWFPGSRVVVPRAETLRRLALGRNDFITAEKLEPIYLRETNFVKAAPSRTL